MIDLILFSTQEASSIFEQEAQNRINMELLIDVLVSRLGQKNRNTIEIDDIRLGLRNNMMWGDYIIAMEESL